MDFDPRITSDGDGYGADHGWSCNFHFGCGHDIIDEDAQSEKCCVQVLQSLIAKADDEIHDLEDELAILQCQLKWAEYDNQRDPYEVSCAVFKRKIDTLTSSIESLRNGNSSGQHVTVEAVEIQKPAERISDIINALIRDKFAEPDEQVVSDGQNLLVDSGSLNIEIDSEQQAGLQLSLECEKLETFPESEEMPEITVSEESSSDASRYAAKDTKEGIDLGKFDDEVTKEAGVDAYRNTPKEATGFLTLKPVMTSTHLLASTGEGNLKSDVLEPGESEKCVTGLKAGESGFSTLSDEVTIKEEIELVFDSLLKSQDPERDDTVEDHSEVTKNQSEIVDNIHITYGRRKSNFCPILKPQGRKLQRKLLSDLGVVRQSTPLSTLKPIRKIEKKKLSSVSEHFTRSSSLSKEEGRLVLLQETNIQEKPRSMENSIHPVEKVPEGESLSLGSRREMCCGLPHLASVEGSVVNAVSAYPHVAGFKSAIVKDQEKPKLAFFDLGNLRLELTRDPEFLKKLTVAEIKEIMKMNQMNGFFKWKKEKLIEVLMKKLGL